MDLPIRRRRGPEPDSDFSRLRRSLTEDLERWPLFADDLITDVATTLRDVTPQADIEESDDAYTLHIELPGVAEPDVSVDITPTGLTVLGERRERRRVGFLRHQTRTTGRFRFDVRLPLQLDPDAATATLQNGLLTVTAPKAERSRRRRIPIALHR